MTREEILETAIKIVTTDRDKQYGDPEDNFSTIANMWSAYLRKNIDAIDVAAMMILLKVARVGSGQAKDDNWIDIAGYAACGGEIEMGDDRK